MGSSSSKPDPTPSKPDPPPELDTPWRRIDWGQKEELKKQLEQLSVSNPDVRHIRILAVGQIGAGKSSFINSINNIFQGRITSSAIADSSGCPSSHSFTRKLTTHHFRSADGDLPFSLSDTMGLEPHALAGCLTEDIVNVIRGHVKDDYKFDLEEPLSHKSEDYISDPLLSDQFFGLVYVVDATTVQSLDERLADKLRIIRTRIRDKRIPQVIVMTKVDEACLLVKKDLKKIYTSKKIREKMEMCENKIGVPMNYIFPVKNYHDEDVINNDVDVLILKALEPIVNLANDRLREASPN